MSKSHRARFRPLKTDALIKEGNAKSVKHETDHQKHRRKEHGSEITDLVLYRHMSFPVEFVLHEQLVNVFLYLTDLGGQFLDPYHFKKYVPGVQLLNTNAVSFIGEHRGSKRVVQLYLLLDTSCCICPWRQCKTIAYPRLTV